MKRHPLNALARQDPADAVRKMKVDWSSRAGYDRDEFEAAVSRDARASFYYARDVVEGRFELGEPAIALSAEWSYNYAFSVLGGVFSAGEAAIATDIDYACSYASLVMKNRWRAIEARLWQRRDLWSKYVWNLLHDLPEMLHEFIMEFGEWRP